VHVALANFIDTMIDYPRSKEYSFEMFDKLGTLGILTEDQIAKYKQHVLNLENYEEIIEEGVTKTEKGEAKEAGAGTIDAKAEAE
jgi:hypothetical protein